ncbi:MAG TPA: ribulose-phosphate 3-epimerase, partial [Candidatus Aminicenantes bacterium]|nr:ribulose-phosphate 3-epimerase [Candidatus Aminicenantes bacterium]
IRDSLPYVDFVLVMSVSPGYGGQPFIPETLVKIETIRKWVAERGLTVPIEVDGGVTTKTIPSLKEAGAEIFVAGSAIFGAPDPMEALKTLKELTL